ASEGDSQVIPDYSLSLEDYQELQNKLYVIGNTANKSIVTVTTIVSETDWMNNAYETEGQGSGVIIEADSNYYYVLTEKKVIQDASRVRITFIDETSADATLLKYDGNTGIAILAVEKRHVEAETAQKISIAKLGNSYAVKNGTIVIALGSPLGTNYSILTGNITSTNNQIMTLDKNYDVFTTDIVASEKGSGILINTKGEMIGMVIQAFSGSQDVNTLTAVSISDIRGEIERLVQGKNVPYIGLYVSTVTKNISDAYDIPLGVFVKEVMTDSPAMYAGLQSGDVITQVNGENIYSDATYSSKIQMLLPGTTCEFTVLRQNGNEYMEIKCEVQLGILE
ncbi:MAG: S1C family serine protease, partial [Agathobacter sp.]